MVALSPQPSSASQEPPQRKIMMAMITHPNNVYLCAVPLRNKFTVTGRRRDDERPYFIAISGANVGQKCMKKSLTI